MQICTNRDAIATIDLDECVGVSLATINTNFDLLKEGSCTTTTDIEDLNGQSNTIINRINSLSGEMICIPKALTVFDASQDPIQIIKSLRVKSVSALDTGSFQLSFDPVFDNTDYGIVGICSQTTASSKYVWVQPLSNVTTSKATINIQNEDGVKVNPSYVSITIF
jgi:hypothetical protein